jgi:hypothetical protein
VHYRATIVLVLLLISMTKHVCCMPTLTICRGNAACNGSSMHSALVTAGLHITATAVDAALGCLASVGVGVCQGVS